MRTEFKWEQSPEVLTQAAIQYGDRVALAVREVARYIAQKLQDDARRNARWVDRTGNARSGLVGTADEVATYAVDVYLSHSVDYGKWLELAHGQKYAIIMPTIQRNLPEIERMLKRIFT